MYNNQSSCTSSTKDTTKGLNTGLLVIWTQDCWWLDGRPLAFEIFIGHDSCWDSFSCRAKNRGQKYFVMPNLQIFCSFFRNDVWLKVICIECHIVRYQWLYSVQPLISQKNKEQTTTQNSQSPQMGYAIINITSTNIL